MEEKSHRGASVIATTYLQEKYPRQIKGLIDKVLEDWWPDNVPSIEEAPRDVVRVILSNATEYAITEGEIEVSGRNRRLSEIVLTEAGHLMSDAQQEFIERAGKTPLRLYTITSVNPGVSLDLLDVVDAKARPITVMDSPFSERLPVACGIGARVIRLGDATHHVLSGCQWIVHPLSVSTLWKRIEQTAGIEANRKTFSVARQLARFCVEERLVGVKPAIMDAATGDTLVLITDRYSVIDEAELARRLGDQRDVRHNGPMEWLRVNVVSGKGEGIIASIYPGDKTGDLCVFYKTKATAADGKTWFERVAAGSVRFEGRETQTTEEIFETPPEEMEKALAKARSENQIPPDVIVRMVEQMYHEQYRNWADRPLPLLGNKSPREVCATNRGAERVRGILNLYEDNEKSMAKQQGRQSASLQFLWDEVGLKR